MKKHIIDLEKAPKIPNWGTLVEHKGKGKIDMSKQKFELHLEPEQKNGSIVGNILKEKLGDNVLNINIAQYFIDNPKEYPEEWKGKYVHFWGTIIRDGVGDLVVPFLCEIGGTVVLGWLWLGDVWDRSYPALRFASMPLETLVPKSSETLHSELSPSDLQMLYERIERLEEFKQKVENILKLE